MTSALSSPARLAGFLLLLANLGCHTTPTSLSNRLNISNDGARVEYAGVGGETALETLQELTDVDVRITELGEFVTGIAQRSATGGNQYWVFFVNDQAVRIGAGNYVAKPGDRITWLLKTYGSSNGSKPEPSTTDATETDDR